MSENSQPSGKISGFEQQISILYEEYKDQVFGIAYKNLKSTDRSHDIVQEVFTVLCQKDLAEIRNMRSYIFQITQHKVVDQLRTIARNRQLQQEMWEHIATSQKAVDQALIEKEYLDCLERAKSLLTNQQLMIFEMSRKEGLSHRKIAEKLNLSPNTVKNHMVSALKTLREYLQINSDVVISMFLFLFFW